MMHKKKCITLNTNIWLMTIEGLASVHLYHFPPANDPNNPFHHELMPLTDTLPQLCSEQFDLLDGIRSLKLMPLWYCW